MSSSVKLLAAAMLIGGMLAAVPAGTAATQSDATLEVAVVDQDGDGIGGVTITATWDDGSRTETTASNGRAFVDVPEGADVELNVTAEEYVRNHPFVVRDATSEEVTVDMARKGRATVVVRDTDGNPVEDVGIELQQEFRVDAAGETDDTGQFSTGTIEQGEYELTAVRPDFFEEVRTISVDEETREEVELERGQVPFEVAVVDDHFDEPRSLEAQVTISDAQGQVGQLRATGGRASIDVGVNNQYTVAVEQEGYQRSERTVEVDESARSVQIATQRVPELTLEPQNDRVVVGESTTVRVVNAYDEPVAGVEVTRNNETVGETDENGELVVPVESTGSQGLQAVQGDLRSDVVAVEGVEPADEPTPTPTPTDETVGDAPGFGALVALVALLAAALLARRR